MTSAEHIEPPFEAYDGDEPFIFVSYSHKDCTLVYPEIARLHKLGFRIWYDEGIDPGNEWPEEVASALARSSFFLVFISTRAAVSKNVKNEINFAINHQKPFVAIHVEATNLPKGLELRMGDIQAILKYRMNADRFNRQMEKTLPQTLRDEISVATVHQPSAVEEQLANKECKETEPKTHRKAGDTITLDLINGVALDLIWCPEGSFWMGSQDSELGHHPIEVWHRVTLTQGFWIGKFPVTQEQWEVLMGSNPSCFETSGKEAPVEMVSWEDCQNFLTRLQPFTENLFPKMHVRLPTEAEWEYACRAGTETALNNGKWLTNIDHTCPSLDTVGWYDENSGRTTHTVGQKKPNPWKIFDMHGNVWECCADWFDDYPSGDTENPPGPASGVGHVIRGGSWDSLAVYCRSSFRNFFDLKWGIRRNCIGLRVVVAAR